ncbi:lipid A hydroxylase LpxO [Serratia nevei]|jgi:Aspartyl/asparaginyl beta-hydroxylase and related dioxygenases|uniref:lipid A hydroxylase LpxO n=1 Tax=Serratia TaxID=613 RepID=UPI0011C84EC0|nr:MULTISPECIES: lipid A hydroxylase LpxO [Serratia]MBH3271816.1 lipid A hydroxylase LpxO [Serratia marcescens]MDI3148959.1 lipid A hydroxylase LpxO [Serratia nevei]QHC45619.1 lipid A hydroxylase LpxO [Serratia marcescens]TXE72669.1 lipid A hydroxylase LpxO [Serratia nevei]GJK47693.1 aspartyl/asparaginyl beta-hydroxylase [Serratia marcescens]
MKYIILILLILCVVYVHYRGRVRYNVWRQLSDHSTFTAPLNVFMYLFSRVPTTPYLKPEQFPELAVLRENWETIRDEGQKLMEIQQIKASDQFNDAGFNSFFKTGWKRFYLKWYEDSHPSAMTLCPQTTELLRSLPSVKAAMFAELPDGSRLPRHRDPYAGSLRYHLGLITPNDDRCFIEVDGERYSWRDGEGVMFDETYLHYAENQSGQNRLILFCDIERPMRYRWAQVVNHWLGRNLMSAATAPNEEGDRTGGVNKMFKYIYAIRRVGKRLKAWNRTGYYIIKWILFGGIAAAIFFSV